MLAQTHITLEGHFNELSRERAAHGYPVYAFEHGLEPAQIVSLREALANDLVRTKRLNREHWLLWTVVAAEIGYAYDGDEYWDSFQSEVPQKITLADRETIRDWFKAFTRQFNGFQPTGRWAEHFSIIAWPITHSILPRYLQSLFARHLYELRHDLAAKDETSIDQLGQLLGSGYHGDSSRFGNFLQQTALTACLVLALRDEDVQGRVTPIYRPTLARIVHDLEQKGSSRGYLRDARRVLRDARLRVRPGLAAAGQSGSATTIANRDALAPPPGIKLIARCKQDDSWTLGVAFPDFSNLMIQTGIDLAALDKSRARFADKPDGWMPGRALLSYSDSTHALSSLPIPLSEPVVRFRDTDEMIKPLAAHLKILSRPPWLLRVHDDGVARQVLGNHVRTAADYILASTDGVAPELVHALSLSEAVSHTAGIKLYRMTVPVTVTPPFIQAIQKLSFGYALRAHVKTFGLAPRWDDASGSSVWLVNEEIVIHLSADFPVSEFAIAIDGTARTRIPVSDQRDVLVSLGMLPLGRHAIEIVTTAAPIAGNSKGLGPVAPETIFLEVRAPKPWRRDTAGRTGLRVIVEPNGASLEDLVDKRATLSLHGPEGRAAAVEARLYDMSGHVSSSSEIGRLELPANAGSMARLIEKLAKEPLSERIQSAPRVALSFIVDEIGTATASFPHTVVPLRWKLDRDDTTTTMRLVDEAGAAASITVNRFDMATPDKRVEVPLEVCLQGTLVEPPGSLYVARYDGKIYPAFASVPPRGRLTGFGDLAAQITLTAPGESTRNIMRLIALLRFWRRARAHGVLAAVRKTNVISVFEVQIERLACGARWTEKTQQYRANGGRIEDLQGDVGGSPGFASRMRTTEWTWHSDIARARAEFLRLANTYGVCSDKTVSDLALRLAFNPTSIRLNDPKEGARNFETLGTMPVLARGAYFARMTSDLRFRQTQEQPGAAQ